MKSTHLNLVTRHDPICPGCYCGLTERNITIAMQVALCAECANMQRPIATETICITIHTSIHPRHLTNSRGITLFAPANLPPAPLLMLAAHDGDPYWLNALPANPLAAHDSGQPSDMQVPQTTEPDPKWTVPPIDRDYSPTPDSLDSTDSPLP